LSYLVQVEYSITNSNTNTNREASLLAPETKIHPTSVIQNFTKACYETQTTPMNQ